MLVAALWVCRVGIAESDVRIRLQSLAVADALLVVVQVWAAEPFRRENSKDYWRQFSWRRVLIPLTVLSAVLLGFDILGVLRILF